MARIFKLSSSMSLPDQISSLKMVIGEVSIIEVYMCSHGQRPGAALGLSQQRSPMVKRKALVAFLLACKRPGPAPNRLPPD